MRKNVTRVFSAFEQGKFENMGSISTDGESIASYRTCLVTPMPDVPKTVVLNASRYSVTTSQQQGSLRVLLKQAGFTVVEVSGLERGVWPDDLLRAATVTA